jgi:uncharacterized protein YcfJ
MKTFILAAVIAVSSLTGCAGLDEHQQRVGSGALIGAGAGALIGGNATGAVIGAIGGALIGSEVDRNVQRDRNDSRYWDARRAYEECRRNYSRRECDDRRY